MFTKSETTDVGIRCGRCNKYLAELASRPWRILCARCGHTNIGAVRPAPAAPVAPIVPEKPVRRRRRPRRTAARG